MQAVDKLPLIPDFFEIVGILFSGVSSRWIQYFVVFWFMIFDDQAHFDHTIAVMKAVGDSLLHVYNPVLMI